MGIALVRSFLGGFLLTKCQKQFIISLSLPMKTIAVRPVGNSAAFNDLHPVLSV
jgi:hypothetical protein